MFEGEEMIRIFEAFAGYGTSSFALKHLGIEHELVGFSEIDKYAIKCFEQNHCDTLYYDTNLNQMKHPKNYGDITKINWKEVPDFDLLTGGFPCSPEGTLVKTITGYKKIEDVIPSDLVLTHNNKYCTVIKTMSRMSNHLNYINAVGCNNLALTDEHPMYVFRDNKIDWVPVKQLKKGDYISYNINNGTNNIFSITKKEAWLLGRYAADGYLDKERNRIIFCIGKKKIKEFNNYITKYNPWISHKLRPAPEFIIKNDRIFSFCENIGCGAKNKEIPQYILELPKNILKSFLDGYIAGDGHIDKNTRYRIMFSTVSEKLYYGIQDIFIKIYKRVPSLYIRKDNKSETFSDAYCGQLCLNTRDSFIKQNKIFCKIKNIERINTDIRVYNFEVENDNSYTLNNVIVHNCQAFSNAGKGLGEADHRGQLGMELTKALQIKQPKYFLFENVKGFMGKKFTETREKFIKSWEDAGYKVYYEVLNTKDYGIPQNRQRVWFVGIRKDIQQDFKFPVTEELKLKLKDILEQEVDEKYYLKGGLLAWWEKNKEKQLQKQYSSLNADCAIAQTARQYASWCGNYIQGDVSGKGYKSQQDRIYNPDGYMCCLPSTRGENKVNILDAYNNTFPKDQDTSTTLRTNYSNENMQVIKDARIRRLTPKECFRLQGFLKDDVDLDGIPSSACYKLAGNGQTCTVVEKIFERLLKQPL